jgi:adenosine deaminase CECR1
MPFTSEEWEEVSQDIPKPEDQFIQKYLQGREGLISQEDKQRSGKTPHVVMFPVRAQR